MDKPPALKPLYWVGSSNLPCAAWQKARARHASQRLRICRRVGACRGLGSTYRAVYTVRFAGAVFVLHVFRKKSTRGVATPKADIDLIRGRLRVAEQIAKEMTR